MPSAKKIAETVPLSFAADTVERRKLEQLTPYPRNPRTHSPEQINVLCEMIREFGFTAPLLIDEEDMILAGHGRTMAARKLGFVELPVVVLRGLSEEQKRAIVVADNRSSELAGWDKELLSLELGELKRLGFDLDLTGFKGEDLVMYMAGDALEQGEQEALDNADRGKLLELIKITIAEPEHKVSHGDIYRLSDRHTLACFSVIGDWKHWHKLVKDDDLFCPYAGVFVPFSTQAKEKSMVMVQPDTYIAGHLLDRYGEVHGKKSIKQVT